MATWLWIVIIVAAVLAVFGYFGRGRFSRYRLERVPNERSDRISKCVRRGLQTITDVG